ncbi:hypothetical protein A2974_03765 [Candidatus Peregrinibacteria bacterium RIFCSPLOWO2_01_FULL_48_20]|nr:MAG: hypothetical protein A2974_03765 [Candidatus Peregrinibacteria bacterium RIFCSPLOWO2_01_FULL_48_20]
MESFTKHSLKRSTSSNGWIKSHIFLSIVALVLGILTLRGVVGAMLTGNPFSVKQIFYSAVGSSVKMDAYEHTNILLIGVGGEGHDGENLTDTMIVASLNHNDNLVSMISIPRDLYVENEMVGWGTRLNSIYEYILDDTDDPALAMDELKTEIEDILDVDIHYYAKIDFQGFEEVVDALGGVTVDVDQTIIDDAYPAAAGSDYLFDPFYLQAGTQELDGETALKYVRSRHNTSDFDRAARQQQMLEALKNKALSMGVLANPAKIKDVYWAISRNFETDMSLTEIVSLVEFAEKLTGDSVLSAVLNEEANKMGGFLYTPPREEGDPYVLVPYTESFIELQLFAQLFFYHPEIYADKVAIQVLNGTKAESIAGLTKMYLVRYGFNVVNYGNAATAGVEKTRIIPLRNGINDEEVNRNIQILPSLTQGEIMNEVPPEYAPAVWPTEAEVIIELGEDFVDFYEENDELFYLGVY